MRGLGLLSFALIGLAPGALAADLGPDYLRGSIAEATPVSPHDWSGFYIGGHGGFSETQYDFGRTNVDIVARLLRQTTIENEAHVSDLANLPNASSRGGTFGVFAGYNWTWEDVVLGIEADWTRGAGRGFSSDSIGRSFVTSDNFRYDYSVNSSAAARLTDYGSLRARVGYAIGSVMPFATAGVAVGHGSYDNRASVDLVWTDATAQTCDASGVCTPILRPGGATTLAEQRAKTDAYTFGFALGAGVDVAVLPNLFVRAEYQFLRFASLGKTVVDVNTVRGAIAAKF